MRESNNRAVSDGDVKFERSGLGWLLPMLPPTYEALFWAKYNRLSGTDKDNQTLYIHVFHELLFLFRVCTELPAAVRGTLQRNCAKCLILNLLHFLMRLTLPEQHAACRWILVVHRRLFYTLGYISNVQAIFRVAARPAALTSADFDAVFSYHLLSGTSNSPATLLRSLLIGSCALWNLIHALPFPTPCALEIPIQLAYLWASFRYVGQLATSYFAAPRFAPAAAALCHAIASVTQPAWLPSPAHLPPPAHICNTPQAAWVLTIFHQVFVGCLLTLYCSYHVERHLKLRFLQHLRSTTAAPAHVRPPADPDAPSAPNLLGPQPQARLQLLLSFCKHVACLWVLAALAWSLAVACRKPLARAIRPLNYPGAHLEWYWQLTCDSVQWPGCPA